MNVRIENSWRAFIREALERDGLDVFLLQDFGEDRVRILQPDGSTKEVGKWEAATDYVPPTFQFNRAQAEAVADALAAKGFLPKSRRFQQEHDLLRAHLEDMRALVFKGKRP